MIGVISGAALAIATASAIGSDSNPTPKEAFLQQHANERATAQAGPRASKQSPPAALIAQPDKPQRQAGILQVRQGPVSSQEFVVLNTWQGPMPGSASVWYVVWAGSTGSASANPGTPGVIVHLQEPTSDGYSVVDTTVGTFLDPKADGPLSIVSVTGAIVSLSSPSGHLFYFHLDTDQFT